LRENAELRNRIARLKTDDEFLEKMAREKLGLVRKGELVYHFEDPSDATVR
jgi:cell division protein FtsB